MVQTYVGCGTSTFLARSRAFRVAMLVPLYCLTVACLLLFYRRVQHWETHVESGLNKQPSAGRAPAADKSTLQQAVRELLATAPPASPLPLQIKASAPDAMLPEISAGVKSLRVRIERESKLWPEAVHAQSTAHADELTLARFLIAAPASSARRNDVAFESFHSAMVFKSERRASALVREFHPAVLLKDSSADHTLSPRQRAVRSHFYAGFGGTCRDGSPYIVERLGAADHSALNGDAEMCALMTEAFIAHYELFTLAVRRCSAATGALVKGLVIVDMRGLGLGLELLRNMKLTNFAAASGTANFPEGTDRIMVINAPRVVASLWAVIKPILPVAVQAKVSILSEPASAPTLREHIDPKDLPTFLGGEREEATFPAPLALPVRAGSSHPARSCPSQTTASQKHR